jgi:hypothetical protein
MLVAVVELIPVQVQAVVVAVVVVAQQELLTQAVAVVVVVAITNRVVPVDPEW